VVRALYRLRQRLRGTWSLRQGLGRDLLAVLGRPLDTLLYSAAHGTGSRRLVRTVTMEMIVEPEPDPLSRVQLDDQVDALGMHRVRVDWRLTNNVARTVDRTFELVAAALREKGIASVTLDDPVARRGWPHDLEGTYHHMGTTRMHESPRLGVVDRHCQVHGIGNLHVAGSSVFPTSSSNHPTMTLVALALRLADRLTEQMRAPHAVPVEMRAGSRAESLA
jgi:choline dehydrogenase-like flavoprotein